MLGIGIWLGPSAAPSAAASGTLSAPTLGYPSPIASNPTSIAIHIPVDWQSADALKLAYSSSSAMTSPTVLSHTINDTDITNGFATISIPTLGAETYFQGYGSHSGADSVNKSNIVAWGDTTAPTITTSATQTAFETAQLAILLTATDSGGVPALLSDGASPGWLIDSGADQLEFQCAIVAGVPTLQWINNGTQSTSVKLDQTLNNTYNVTVAAIDYSGNKGTLAVTTTVNAIDQAPDGYSFTNVSNATHSTVYTSNTVTISGMTPGFDIASTFTGSGTYSKNGGAFVSTTPFTARNGDTFALQATSGSADSMSLSLGLNIGLGSATWVVSTPGSSATLTTGTGTTGAGTNRAKFVDATSFQTVMNANVGGATLDRATVAAANTKFQVEVTLAYQGTGSEIYIGFDDGTTDLNAAGSGFTSQAHQPGNAAGGGAAPGFLLELQKAQTLPAYTGNGTRANTATMTALADGQVITLDVDTSAHTIILKQNGTTIQTFTLTTQIPSSWYFLTGGAVGNGTPGAGQSDTATVNFGASAWSVTLPSGYSYYA